MLVPANRIKTASELKAHIEEAGHDPHFFTRETMRFFGDTMRNYGVRRVTVRCDYDGEGNYSAVGFDLEAYELYRRHPVKHGNIASAYFAADTFKRVFPRERTA